MHKAPIESAPFSTVTSLHVEFFDVDQALVLDQAFFHRQQQLCSARVNFRASPKRPSSSETSETLSGSSKRNLLSILRVPFQLLLHRLGKLVENLIRFALDNSMSQGGQLSQDIDAGNKCENGFIAVFPQD